MTPTSGDRLVVVGDSFLDVDIDGHADRLCPDAPAPVIDRCAEQTRPGGAALAAALAGTRWSWTATPPTAATTSSSSRWRTAEAAVAEVISRSGPSNPPAATCGSSSSARRPSRPGPDPPLTTHPHGAMRRSRVAVLRAVGHRPISGIGRGERRGNI
jgi:D-beta-D-heptose 7-phosphate kinase/D-beta-D-heptose 1-phosphate adenosyltransferase